MLFVIYFSATYSSKRAIHLHPGQTQEVTVSLDNTVELEMAYIIVYII